MRSVSARLAEPPLTRRGARLSFLRGSRLHSQNRKQKKSTDAGNPTSCKQSLGGSRPRVQRAKAQNNEAPSPSVSFECREASLWRLAQVLCGLKAQEQRMDV